MSDSSLSAEEERALRAVKVPDERVRLALADLGRPGTLAESIVWAAANAFLAARAALSPATEAPWLDHQETWDAIREQVPDPELAQLLLDRLHQIALNAARLRSEPIAKTGEGE